MHEEPLLTLDDLRQRHNLPITLIAEVSHLPMQVVYRMIVRQPVTRAHANRVLCAVSDLTGIAYGLDTVAVPLLDAPVPVPWLRVQADTQCVYHGPDLDEACRIFCEQEGHARLTVFQVGASVVCFSLHEG